jgi:NAD(P)-dependent dehydrogenase (short-subunit alcohol dehydrogenase family)
MGGIGQHIASWLMEKGAKNLLIVSRSAASSSDAPAMKAMAEADSCNLQIRSCDVGNEQSFVDMLAEVANIMPPIRGVVNAAMVLEVCLLPTTKFCDSVG